MPIAPFHFGPGALIHSIAPKKISFIAFCTENVLIDIENLYYMLTQQWQNLKLTSVAIGAVIGIYTHIYFDSIMHSKMQPFAPSANLKSLFI